MRRPTLAVLCDSPDENWAAMDLVAEMLVREIDHKFSDRVEPVPISIDLPRVLRRPSRLSGSNAALNFDRIMGRFVRYPARVLKERRASDLFHVVDHSYAQLVHVLPAARTGVYCHDLDAFRSLFKHAPEPRPLWFRAIQRVVLAGLQRAAVVFHSTNVVRSQIEREGVVHGDRLVHAPYGISPEFVADHVDDRAASELLAPMNGRRYLLHVGSGIPRKRLDVLFDTFARLRETHRDLVLLQNGAALNEGQRAHVDRLGIRDALVQPHGARLSRTTLAALYRRAAAVLVTSDAEGFGIPVLEGLACGAVVFASDIPVLREVGGAAAVYCRVGDPVDWAAHVDAFLTGRESAPPRNVRIARASGYSWENHARIIVEAYEALGSTASR